MLVFRKATQVGFLAVNHILSTRIIFKQLNISETMKIKKLKLNKEVLAKLQEKQMDALAGGMADGNMSTTNNPVSTGMGCNTASPTHPAGGFASPTVYTSCCKKSCNRS